MSWRTKGSLKVSPPGDRTSSECALEQAMYHREWSRALMRVLLSVVSTFCPQMNQYCSFWFKDKWEWVKHVPDGQITRWKFRDFCQCIRIWPIPQSLMKKDWVFLVLKGIISGLKAACQVLCKVRIWMWEMKPRISWSESDSLWPAGKQSNACSNRRWKLGIYFRLISDLWCWWMR